MSIATQTTQSLKASEISSKVFVIAPTQLDEISKQFSSNLAETMNMKPLSQHIYKTAREILEKVLRSAKTMGE